MLSRRIIPLDGGVICVRVRVQVKVAIILAQALDLQAAVDENPKPFADLCIGAALEAGKQKR